MVDPAAAARDVSETDVAADADADADADAGANGATAAASPPPQVWSDFTRVRLHAKSLLQVPFWDVRNGAFSMFRGGDFGDTECALPHDVREDAYDRLRLQLEACDHLQGWSCTVDAQGGFAGLARSLVEEARDQCRTATIGCFVLLDPPTLPTDMPVDEGLFNSAPKVRARAGLDHALCVHSLLEQCSIVVPIDSRIPSLQAWAPDDAAAMEGGDAARLFRDTALIAAGVDSMTLPYRHPRPPTGPLIGMANWAAALCPRQDYRLVSLDICAPLRVGGLGIGPLLPLSPSSGGVAVPAAADQRDQIPPPRSWSRLAVARGPECLASERWAELAPLVPEPFRFELEAPLRVPAGFPRFGPDVQEGEATAEAGAAEVAAATNGRHAATVCTSAGATCALRPFIRRLVEAVDSKEGNAVFARRTCGLDDEDATNMAEDLRNIEDAYED